LKATTYHRLVKTIPKPSATKNSSGELAAPPPPSLESLVVVVAAGAEPVVVGAMLLGDSSGSGASREARMLRNDRLCGEEEEGVGEGKKQGEAELGIEQLRFKQQREAQNDKNASSVEANESNSSVGDPASRSTFRG
jgi:hypothetical protein